MISNRMIFTFILVVFARLLTGAFMDATGSYDASFYLSGSLIFMSAVICYPLKRINTWERRNGKDTIVADPSSAS